MSPATDTDHHVAHLGDAGVGEHALAVALERRHQGGDEDACETQRHEQMKAIFF